MSESRLRSEGVTDPTQPLYGDGCPTGDRPLEELSPSGLVASPSHPD